MSSTKEIYREVLEASNRRSFLRKASLASMAGAVAPALVPLFTPTPVEAAPTPSPELDPAILNFALNLEYVEAQFYLYATTGSGLSDNNGTTAGGDGTDGGSVIIKDNPKVPFQNDTVAALAMEIAQDEATHVAFLQKTLGAASVAAPNLDLLNSFITLGQLAAQVDPLANIPAQFDPFADDVSFLMGAFIFEDVGVTAYRGASPLIYDVATYIPAASGILSVEAFHAAEIRSLLYIFGKAQLGVTTPNAPSVTSSVQILRAVQAISAVRDSVNPSKGGTGKDQGITSDGTPTGTANIVPTDEFGPAVRPHDPPSAQHRVRRHQSHAGPVLPERPQRHHQVIRLSRHKKSRGTFAGPPFLFAARTARLQFEEVLQQPLTLGSQNALGVELDAVDRELPVAQPHDLAFRRARVDFQAVRHAVGPYHQRVVTRRLKGIRQPGEHSIRPVEDGRGLAVHQTPGAHHLPAEHLADGLVPQAHAQQRHGGAEFADEFFGDARVFRLARAGTDANLCGPQFPQFVYGDLVVATHDRFRPEFAEILDEVVREGVVVIEDEKHGRKAASPALSASSAL